jgi:hypothetical protein
VNIEQARKIERHIKIAKWLGWEVSNPYPNKSSWVLFAPGGDVALANGTSSSADFAWPYLMLMIPGWKLFGELIETLKERKIRTSHTEVESGYRFSLYPVNSAPFEATAASLPFAAFMAVEKLIDSTKEKTT